MARDSLNICILGATFNTANLGVSVLAAGAIRCVLHKFPDANIIQLDYAKDGSEFKFSYAKQMVNIRFVNIRFSKKLYLSNHIAKLLLLAVIANILRPVAGIRRKLLSVNPWLQQVFKADLVVSLAGGDSFSDIYGLTRLIYVSLPQILAIVLGRRLVLLPQTIGPFQYRFSKMIARFILNRAEIIYCRDRASVKSTRALLGLSELDKKVRFCYDVGFDVESRPANKLTIVGLSPERNSTETLVGFNVSGLLAIGGYNQNNMFGLAVPYEHLVLKLISFLIEKHSATVLLIPHVFGSSTENDVAACERIFSLMQATHPGKIGLLCGVECHDEVKYVIGTCGFLIGSRMHACINALSQNVPAVSIAYSDKFAGVMESIGVSDLVVDPRVMNEDEILRVVDQAYRERLRLRRELGAKMPFVKQTIKDVLSDFDLPIVDQAEVLVETNRA